MELWLEPSVQCDDMLLKILNAFIKISSTQPRGPQTISGSINGNSSPCCMSEVFNKLQSFCLFV